MKTLKTKINTIWLTKPTGDAFADVGGYVINYLMSKYPQKNIMELIVLIAEIYVHRWDGKINPFFLNSAITQPAFKGERKIQETVKYFTSIIDETCAFEEGYCRISGQRTKLFKSGRDNTLLSGSGGFVNFHHTFQEGMMLSKEMLIRMFFIPFGSLYIGGRIGIVQSNNDLVNEFFVVENCKANFSNIAIGTSEGVLKSDYGIPANALFYFVDDLFVNQIKNVVDSLNNLTITLYHLTNFGASPEISIYTLPSSVFKFYSTCQSPNYKNEWRRFLYAHYTNSKFKGAKYDIQTSNYLQEKKGVSEEIQYQEYKAWRNIVLENLLNGRSLLKLFLNWSRKHTLSFSIVEIYQKNIQNMKAETLSKIKELAAYITANDDDIIKKNIQRLDGAKYAYQLRRFFLKSVTERNYKEGAKEPKITVEELVYYLFPDDLSWKEIRDILLFAIYQELHTKGIYIDGIVKDIEEDDSENENTIND